MGIGLSFYLGVALAFGELDLTRIVATTVGTVVSIALLYLLRFVGDLFQRD